MDYRSPAFPYQGVLPCKTEISTHAHGVVCSCEMKQSVTATEHLTSPRGADSAPLPSHLPLSRAGGRISPTDCKIIHILWCYRSLPLQLSIINKTKCNKKVKKTNKNTFHQGLGWGLESTSVIGGKQHPSLVQNSSDSSYGDREVLSPQQPGGSSWAYASEMGPG